MPRGILQSAIKNRKHIPTDLYECDIVSNNFEIASFGYIIDSSKLII